MPMLSVLSPAKRLDFEQPARNLETSEPQFPGQAYELVEVARTLSAADLSALMHISDDLAQLNHQRFQDFKASGSNAVMPAIQAFKGDVYVGFDVDSVSTEELNYAQSHLRILSGLYGLLRPLDLMQAYRLEMGSSLQTAKGKGLYAFWGEQITQALNETLEETNAAALVNLASNEYFKAVKPKLLARPLLTVGFKEYKDGQAKLISFNAKKARGLMARYLVQNQVDKPEGVKDFGLERYSFDTDLSTDKQWIFSREFIPVSQLKKAA